MISIDGFGAHNGLGAEVKLKLRIHSLRKYAAAQVQKAMGPIPTLREPRRWTLPLVAVLGLLPMGLPELPVSWPFLVFHPSQLQELMNWMEWLWGGTATLFTLPVAVTALITGLGVPGTNRIGLFRYFRQRGFDGVVVLGLVLLASSAMAISRALLMNQDVSPIHLGRILAGIIGGLLGLLVALGFLVWQTIVLLSSARDARAQHQRLIRHLDATVHDIAIHLIAEKILGQWAKTHRVLRLHLPLDSFDGNVIRARRQAVIRDIRLGLLTRWAESLQKPVTEKIAALAVTNFTLGKPVIVQERLAVVAADPQSSERAFLRSFRWGRVRSYELTQELMDELVDLAANAVSDCAADRRSSFRVILKVYEDFYAEMLRLTSLLQSQNEIDISSDLVFTSTWTHQLQEVGKAVVANGSDTLISMWLFSIRRLLQIALRYGAKETQIRDFFQLLADYALTIQIPPPFFWKYLDEYQIILDNEAEHGKSPDRQKNALNQMRIQLTTLAPVLLSGLPLSQFHAITDWVERIGAGVDSVSVLESTHALEPAHVLESTHRMGNLEGHLTHTKSVLWLGHGNWLIQHWQQHFAPTALVQRQLRYLRGQFKSLAGLWSAARHICDEGHVTWTAELRTSRSGEIHTQNRVGWGFLLIAISLLSMRPSEELPPDPEAMTWFQDHLQEPWDTMIKNPETWSELTPIPSSYLPMAMDRVREKFLSSQHRGRMEQYQHIAASPMDSQRVKEFAEEVIHSAQAGGLQIVERFAQSGHLQSLSQLQDMDCSIPLLQDVVLSKRAFIHSAAGQEFPTFYPPLWVYEDTAVLESASRRAPIPVSNRSNTVTVLKEAINTLKAGGFHPDFLVVPTDRRLTHTLRSDPSFRPVMDEWPSCIGQLADVSVHQAAHWHNTVIVADLTRWLRLSFCSTLANHGRYWVELRSPTQEELQHWLVQPPKGDLGMDWPLDGEALKIALQGLVVFTLREAIFIEEITSEACLVFQYPERSEGDG